MDDVLSRAEAFALLKFRVLAGAVALGNALPGPAALGRGLASALVLGLLVCPQAMAAAGRCLQGNCQNGSGISIDTDGDLYQGDFSQGLYHGSGAWVSKAGELYKGQFQAGQRQGQGSWADRRGRFRQGEWRANQLNGKGVSVDDEGLYEGQWAANQRHGAGVLYRGGKILPGKFERDQVPVTLEPGEFKWYRVLNSAQGVKSYEGQVDSFATPDGFGTLYTAQRTTVRGAIKQGQPVSPFLLFDAFASLLSSQDLKTGAGQGALFYQNGTRYVGLLQNGLPHGFGAAAMANGEVYVGALQQGAPSGQGTVYLPNGDVYTGGFAKGQKHGKGQLKSQGQVTEMEFAAGRRL